MEEMALVFAKAYTTKDGPPLLLLLHPTLSSPLFINAKVGAQMCLSFMRLLTSPTTLTVKLRIGVITALRRYNSE